jgi:nicotinate phosphoribosyltransferase
MASNSLDEYIIRDLMLQGAKVDSFGVGENLITSKSAPVFGGVYKLVSIADADGKLQPRIKISETVEKITTPDFKNLYRFFDRATGKAIADYITLHDETVDDSGSLVIFDPNNTWKKSKISNFEARPILTPIFVDGKQVYQLPTLNEVRDYCKQQLDTLWDEVKRFEYPHKYYVDLSPSLWEVRHNLLDRHDFND